MNTTIPMLSFNFSICYFADICKAVAAIAAAIAKVILPIDYYCSSYYNCPLYYFIIIIILWQIKIFEESISYNDIHLIQIHCRLLQFEVYIVQLFLLDQED